MGKDSRYNIIHQGIHVEYLPPGSWAIIQQPKKYGDNFWFGRVYDDCFYLEFHKPEPLADCLHYLHSYEENEAQIGIFDDDCSLF